MIIEYAGITFNGTGADDNGVYWYCTELEGWGGFDIRQVTVEPTSEDGVIVANSLKGGKPLGMKIIAKAPNQDAFWAAWNTLEEFCGTNLIDGDPFIVTEGDTRRQVIVVNAQTPRLKMLGGLAFEAELSLLAPNPVKTVV